MRRGFLAETRILSLMVTIGFVLILSAQAPTQNPVGEWNLKTEAQGQVTNFTLTITREGEALKGKVASEQYGAQELTDLKYDNGPLTYTRNLEIGGQGIAMAFKGKIEGDKLTGAYDLMGVELPVTGSRKVPGSVAPAK